MKKTIVYFFILLPVFVFSQKTSFNQGEVLKRETSSFIDTVKTDFRSQDSIHLVFVTNIYSNSKSDFSFTLGYILNSGDMSYIEPNYFFNIKNQIVLVRIDPLTNKTIMKELKMKKITKAEKVKILKKLFPSESGGYIGMHWGLIYSENEQGYIKKFFHNENEIPFEKSIYNKFPIGIKVKKK